MTRVLTENIKTGSIMGGKEGKIWTRDDFLFTYKILFSHYFLCLFIVKININLLESI